MPQMSPISWTLVFLQLIFLMTVYASCSSPLKAPKAKKDGMEKKEKTLKW